MMYVLTGLTLSYVGLLHQGKSFKSDCTPSILDKYFYYPLNLINDSLNGSFFVEFNLNTNGQIKNFKIINSLG